MAIFFVLPAESLPTFSKNSKHAGWKFDGIRECRLEFFQKRIRLKSFHFKMELPNLQMTQFDSHFQYKIR